MYNHEMKTMARYLALVLGFYLIQSSSVWASFFDGDINQTMGSGGYVGTQASADFGGALHLQPSFTEYHGDGTKGYTYRTYSLRAAYDKQSWGLGISGGATPNAGVNGSSSSGYGNFSAGSGYSNYFFGADAVLSLTPGFGPVKRAEAQASNPYYYGPTQAGLAGVDLRGGIDEIYNSEGAAFLGKAAGVNFNQTNIHGSVDAAFLDNLFSVNVAKSLYNQNLGAIGAQNAEVTNLDGLTNIVLGFPDASVNAKIQMQMIPFMTPYLSYTHTTFQLGAQASDAYSFGLAANLMMLAFNASYEHYVQPGTTAQNFITLGASLKL
jgi:hypothetical protein